MRRALLLVSVAAAAVAGGAALAARVDATRPGTEGATAEGTRTRPATASAPLAPARARGDASAPLVPSTPQEIPVGYDGRHQFVRIRYGERGGRGGFGFGRGREPMWAHDYPRAESNFLKILDELTLLPTTVAGLNILEADDPELFRYPVAYIVEVGEWAPSDEEAASLGAWLRKGGFLIVDDFRGRYALRNFEAQMARVLPEARLMLVESDHEIFDAFFRIVPEEVIPPYGAEPPLWLAVFENNDPTARIQVIVNYNNDIGDYWEYSDYGYYPIDLSNEAYKLGVNYVVYAYTH